MFTFKSKPSTGIIGFGAFGKLIVDHLAPHVRLSLHDPAHTKMRLNSGEDFPNTSIAEIAKMRFRHTGGSGRSTLHSLSKTQTIPATGHRYHRRQFG